MARTSAAFGCGAGDWRYLDIVSAQAGKHSAMEGLRTSLGFSHDATVACGGAGVAHSSPLPCGACQTC